MPAYKWVWPLVSSQPTLLGRCQVEEEVPGRAKGNEVKSGGGCGHQHQQTLQQTPEEKQSLSAAILQLAPQRFVFQSTFIVE